MLRRATLAVLLATVTACSKQPPALTETAALEAVAIREEKLARIAAVLRAELVGKPTRGEGTSKQLQRDDEAKKLKAIRAGLQRAADGVVAEVGALGLRVTMYRPLPARPELADREKEQIGEVLVPPCVPESVGKKTAMVGASEIQYGSFKAKWADASGTHGSDDYHPGIAVTRRMYFGQGAEVPFETSGAHVPADLELVVTSCFLADGTPRPQ